MYFFFVEIINLGLLANCGGGGPTRMVAPVGVQEIDPKCPSFLEHRLIYVYDFLTAHWNNPAYFPGTYNFPIACLHP